MKTALITGITGQDGSYLAQLLLEKGYRVCGLVLPEGKDNLTLHPAIADRVVSVEGDITSQASLDAAVKAAAPDEIYNFAAQSTIPLSWTQPVMTGDVTGLGAVRIFEAARRFAPKARLFQASSAAVFGRPEVSPQDEGTAIRPSSPYGAAKAYTQFIAANYRDTHGMHVSCGIFYNHESIRRPPDFVTRKVTLAAARIKGGLQKELVLGDLDAVRDWGFAGDYVRAAWLMLQNDEPGDYILASGRGRTVRDLVAAAFSAAGLEWRRCVRSDEALVRQEGGLPLVGNPAKARARLGWTPEISFERMIQEMVENDLASNRQELRVR